MTIFARQMADFIGGTDAFAVHWPKSYDTCPVCGGKMGKGYQMCRECRNAQRAGAWAEANRPAMRDRHRRFTVALACGWTIAELMALCEAQRLPTMRQMLAERPAEFIRYWYGMAANGSWRTP